MRIVPAGMHTTRMLARERGTGRLLDRKSIHIGANSYGVVRVGTCSEIRAGAALAGMHELAAELAQHSFHICKGLGQVVIELGNPMQIAAKTAQHRKVVRRRGGRSHSRSNRMGSVELIIPRGHAIALAQPCLKLLRSNVKALSALTEAAR